ncbi:MAG: hypothetical protein ACRBG0_19155 [Lewinella sp.]|uniref:hypothetical protein n=1 Tax=Lewinella sp. TaxID=2004506 RepID=UPI003D6B967E
MENLERFEVLIKEGDLIKYLIKCNDDKEASLSFEIIEVISWDGETDDPVDVEKFIRGFIKWDGCSHIYFGDKDGYLHLCGGDSFQYIKQVLTAVWKKAESEITMFDKEVAHSNVVR